MKPEEWQRVKSLCAEALERAPVDRAQFLAEACADSGVRHEVETMLAAYDPKFMEQPVIAEVAEMIVNGSSNRFAAGASVGHYEIVGQIGAGGMGEVYLAQDTRLRRKVALKVLPINLVSNHDRLDRFEREARAAATLNHPNIAHIYEIAEVDGTNFIAMEFIDGETLRAKIYRDNSNLKRMLEWLTQVAEGLAKAHGAGIVHRDLKPDNIMISRDGYAKILDFGLAKLLAPQLPANSEANSEASTVMVPQPLSTPGMIMGTVGYMSPEQAGGRAQIDARSDIFSFGCVLYEAATRQQPFSGTTAVDSLHKIIHAHPPPVNNFNATAPLDLQRVVRRCLAKDPEDRYQTIKDVATELKELLREIEKETQVEISISPKTLSGPLISEGGSETIDASGKTAASTVGAQTKSIAEYAFIKAKRHKFLVASVAALLFIALAIAYIRRPAVAKKPIQSIAVMPFENLTHDQNTEYLSDGLTESLIYSLSRLRQITVIPRSTVFRYKNQTPDLLEVARQLDVQAVLTGRVLAQGDTLTVSVEMVDTQNNKQLWGERYMRKASDILLVQDEIARQVTDTLRVRLTGLRQEQVTKRYTENPEAYRAYLRGRSYWNKGLAPGFEKSREYFREAIDLDPTYALAYAGLGEYYAFASTVGFLPPHENWPRAEAAVNKALALDDTLAESYNTLAAIKLDYQRDWPAAERAFRRGIELNPDFAEIHAHYGVCLNLFGRNEEALAETQRSVELEPLEPRFTFFRGRILLFMRQYDRAIDQFHKTLELDPNYLMAHQDLGDAYEQKGMQTEAIAEWSKALALRGAREQASNLERAYTAAGFEAAVQALAEEQLSKLNEKVKRGEYVSAAEYVVVYRRLGNKEQALAWLDKALQETYSFILIVNVNPIYDKLRDEPRFKDLLRHVGLTQ
jgi:serine/threonine protein kinase/tetratricopeptide (TPR) repeat protein